MKGRLEHSLQLKNKTQQLLKLMPAYVSDFYYSLQSSTEPTTQYEYIRKIKSFLDYVNVDISRVDEIVIGKYFEHIGYTPDKNNGMRETSFSYRQENWTILNRFFNFLLRRGIVTSNPVDTVERPKTKDEIKGVALTMDELNRMLQAVGTETNSFQKQLKRKEWKERDLLILYLFMSTGMRCTALCEINLEDISFERKKIVVTDKRNTKIEYTIVESLEFLIRQWCKKREEILNGKQCEALFISGNKTRLCSRSISNIVKKYSKEGTGKQIAPHKLRASFVTLYHEQNGGDIEETRRAVGHKNIATTSRYIVKKNNAREEAMNFMSSSLKF